jgi:hypothetical protein
MNPFRSLSGSNFLLGRMYFISSLPEMVMRDSSIGSRLSSFGVVWEIAGKPFAALRLQQETGSGPLGSGPDPLTTKGTRMACCWTVGCKMDRQKMNTEIPIAPAQCAAVFCREL